VTPDKLSANFDVYSKGFIEQQNKQVREQGMEKAFNMALQSAQVEMQIYGKPTTDFAKLKKELFKTLAQKYSILVFVKK
jgi:dihydrodipicolinate synthase/N-acetylneuraminate lyase